MTDLIDDHAASRSSDCPACPKAPVHERIDARVASIGEGFVVRRTIPTRQRRMVGAWCFLDHAGPAEIGPGGGLQVGPHPHIGLQTFTWMLEGEILHRDSLGHEQLIRPGQVNLMTAGRGITHSEESPAGASGRVHAAQLWIALPDAQRHCEPDFRHYPELPVVARDGFAITVVAGSALGASAPTRLHSPMVGLDLATTAAATSRLPLEPTFEHAAVCLEGAVTLDGERIEPGTMLYLGRGRHEVDLASDGQGRALLVGGTPFEEEILLWWNFVARTPGEIHQAGADWNAGRHFGDVPGTALPRIPAPDSAGVRFKPSGG